MSDDKESVQTHHRTLIGYRHIINESAQREFSSLIERNLKENMTKTKQPLLKVRIPRMA
jgi:hypothetical protein